MFSIDGNYEKTVFIDQRNNIDLSLINLARRQPQLTFDKSFLIPGRHSPLVTPFKEIRRVDHALNFVPAIDQLSIDYNNLLLNIIDIYKQVLRKINPVEQYFFSCSSGSDSRIIVALLAQLRDEEGFDFSNILFHCWGSVEKEEFLLIMKRFNFNNISILDDSKDDAFDVGNTYIPSHGIYSLGTNFRFWGNHDPSNYIYLSGADGEIFRESHEVLVNRIGYLDNRGEYVNVMRNIFKGIFIPCLQAPLLKIAFAIPRRFKGVRDTRLGRDKLRTDLCYLLGAGDLPISKTTQRFRLNISDSRIKVMEHLYSNCIFYKHFKHKLNFNNIKANFQSYDSQLWNFALTTYEKIYI